MAKCRAALHVVFICIFAYISLLSGYGNLVQGGDSIYRGVDYKLLVAKTDQIEFLETLTYKFQAEKKQEMAPKNTF